jgi:hypothetical protein
VLVDEIRPTILLLSSNLRLRYSEDILSALALPPGARIQFRYNSEYVAPSLVRQVADKTVIGQRALLAFVADVDVPSPFCVPVRLVTVASAECVADIYLFQLRLEEYANLDSQPLSVAKIRASSRVTIEKIREANNKFYAAVTKFPDLQLNLQEGSPAAKWLSVVRRLSQHGTFAKSYFVRIDPPCTQSGEPLSFDADGRLGLTEWRTTRLPVSFYSEHYADGERRTLSVETDGTYLSVSSDSSYEVSSRYDTVELWLQPNPTVFDALARVTVRLLAVDPAAEGKTPSTIARIPVLVRRSRRRLLRRVVSSAVGAFLVAMPAIVGQGAPLTLRVVSGIAGAVLLAYMAASGNA